MNFSEGEIVKAWIPDPKNNPCEEPHPALIVRTFDNDNRFYVIGITGSFDTPIPWYWMPMSWEPNGHPVTGLVKPCVLKAEWKVLCKPSDVLHRMGEIDSIEAWELAIDKVAEVHYRQSRGIAL